MREPTTLEDHEDLYRGILDQLHEGVYLVDRSRRIVYWNAAAAEISGYSAQEVIGSCCADNLLIHVDESGRSLCLKACPLDLSMQDGEPREAEVYLHHKDGHRVPVLVRTAPLRSPGGRTIGGIEVFGENVARQTLREEVETLRRLALQDELTGVGNRRFANMTLQSRHSELERYGWSYGLLMVDIDHFKSFNDRYGHDVGDRVLKMVATTLSSNIRAFDVVSRWGGEEFVVVVEKIDLDGLERRAEILRSLVAASGFEIEGELTSVTISVGGTIARPEEQVGDCVSRADQWLYQSKSEGRNRCTVRL